MEPDVAGYPLEEAKRILEAAGIGYDISLTRPTKHFFPVDESCLYVVRQTARAEGGFCLIVAAKQRKEVSDHGVQDR